jgi:hypothetical protein
MIMWIAIAINGGAACWLFLGGSSGGTGAGWMAGNTDQRWAEGFSLSENFTAGAGWASIPPATGRSLKYADLSGQIWTPADMERGGCESGNLHAIGKFHSGPYSGRTLRLSLNYMI